MTDRSRPTYRSLALGGRPYLLAAGVMVVFLSAFFSPLFLRQQTFSAVANLQRYVYPWATPGVERQDPVSPLLDQANYIHPRQVFLERSLNTDHAVPLWNPMTFGGHAFFAQSGSRLAYPPLLQLSLLSDPTWTHDLYIILHLFAAGVAAFALMRTFRVGVAGALLTGVAWAFGSYTISWIMLEMFAAPAALLPVGLLCVRRWYDGRSRAALLVGAFVMGLLFLGTSVENALFCFICVGGYAASLALAGVIREWRSLTSGRRLALLMAPVVLGVAALAVAAVSLVPFLELSANSERAARSPWTREVSAVPISFFRYALAPPPVPQDVWEATKFLISGQVFVGTATAILAAAGLFLRRAGSGLGRSLVIGLFLFTVGTPVTSLALLVIPRLEALSGFGRTLFLWNLGVAVLGGLGLDALLRRLETHRAGLRDGQARRAWTAAAASIAAVCIVVTGAQLLAHGRNINPRFQDRAAAELYPVTPAVAAARSALGPSRGRGRVIPVNRVGSLPVLLGTVGMAVDLPSASGYETVLPATVTKLSRVIAGEPIESALATLTPRTFLPYFGSSFVRTELLGRSGIAAVLGPPDMAADPTWTTDALASRGLRQTYAGPDGTVYEVLGRPSRATVVTEAVWTGSSPDALRRFVDPSFDGRRQVVLEGEPSSSPPPPPTTPTSTPAVVEWQKDRPDEISLRVTSEQPGWLVLLDGWDPGWKATVNDRKTDVIRANYNFRAVRVPAGFSTVHFSYSPTSVTVGAWVSVLATAVIACAVVPEWARHNRAARRARRRALAGAAPLRPEPSAPDGRDRPDWLGEVEPDHSLVKSKSR